MTETCAENQFTIRTRTRTLDSHREAITNNQRWVSFNRDVLQNILETTIKTHMTQADRDDETRTPSPVNVDVICDDRSDCTDCVVNVDGSTSPGSDSDTESINVTQCDDDAASPGITCSNVVNRLSPAEVTEQVRYRVDCALGDPQQAVVGYARRCSRPREAPVISRDVYQLWPPIACQRPLAAAQVPGDRQALGDRLRLGSTQPFTARSFGECSDSFNTGALALTVHSARPAHTDSMTVEQRLTGDVPNSRRTDYYNITHRKVSLCVKCKENSLGRGEGVLSGDKAKFCSCDGQLDKMSNNTGPCLIGLPGRQHWVRISKAAIEGILDELVVASISEDSESGSRSQSPDSNVGIGQLESASDVTRERPSDINKGHQTVNDKADANVILRRLAGERLQTTEECPTRTDPEHLNPSVTTSRHTSHHVPECDAITVPGDDVITRPDAVQDHGSKTAGNTDVDVTNNNEDVSAQSSISSCGPWSNPATALLLGALCIGEHKKVCQLAEARKRQNAAQPADQNPKSNRLDSDIVDLRTSKRGEPPVTGDQRRPQLKSVLMSHNKKLVSQGRTAQASRRGRGGRLRYRPQSASSQRVPPHEVIDLENPERSTDPPPSAAPGSPLDLAKPAPDRQTNADQVLLRQHGDHTKTFLQNNNTNFPASQRSPVSKQTTTMKQTRRVSRTGSPKSRREPRYGWIVVSKDEVHTIMDSLTSQLFMDDIIVETENTTIEPDTRTKSKSILAQSDILRNKENDMKSPDTTNKAPLDSSGGATCREDLGHRDDDFRRTTIDALNAVYDHEDCIDAGIKSFNKNTQDNDASESDRSASGEQYESESETDACLQLTISPECALPGKLGECDVSEKAADMTGQDRAPRGFKWKSSILARVLDDQDTDESLFRKPDPDSSLLRSRKRHSNLAVSKRAYKTNKRR